MPRTRPIEQSSTLCRCHGPCTCRPIKSLLLRRVLPFPNLVTDVHLLPNFASDGENMSMTTYTVFMAQFKQTDHAVRGSPAVPAGCFVTAIHVASASVQPQGAANRSQFSSSQINRSRVRLDSMSLMSHGVNTSCPHPCRTSCLPPSRPP